MQPIDKRQNSAKNESGGDPEGRPITRESSTAAFKVLKPSEETVDEFPNNKQNRILEKWEAVSSRFT